MRTITYVLVAVLFILIGCAHTGDNSAVFEGIHGKNNIRVFVQVQTEMTDPHCEGSKCRQLLVQSARERCVMLLVALMQYKNNDKSIIFKGIHPADAIDSPVIKKIKCKEYLCSGLVDFKVADNLPGIINNTDATRKDDGESVGDLDVSKDE